MKIIVKLEFKNGMEFQSKEFHFVKTHDHLQQFVQKMILENGVELGTPIVTYITDPEEKRDPKNLAWIPAKLGVIKEGSYVTQILSNTPRKIVKIVRENNLVTLYEENRKNHYFKANAEYPMDLLIDFITREPVTNLEAYYE
jgi:hypothetical protein